MTAAPAQYFPLAHGRYDVAPGLSRFGTPSPRRAPRASPASTPPARAFLRVERQTTWRLPAVGASLFTIPTYLDDCDARRREPGRRTPLCGQ